MAQDSRNGAPRRDFAVAPPDSQVIVITGLFIVSFLWFGGQVLAAAGGGEPFDQFDMVFAILVGGMTLWRGLLAVRGYRLLPDTPDGPVLLIRRVVPWGAVPVPLSRLRAVDAEPGVRGILNNSMLGLGSLFGWAGPANVPDLGSVLVYATSRKRTVLLELAPRPDQHLKTSDGTEPRGPSVLVSPRDPAALATALAPYVQGARRPGLPGMAAAPPRAD